jgi:diketogulonate reductase-like aldo/keto reductase
LFITSKIQSEDLKYDQLKKNIILTAYSPLAQGEVFNNSVLKDLGEKYDKSPAQLTLR